MHSSVKLTGVVCRNLLTRIQVGSTPKKLVDPDLGLSFEATGAQKPTMSFRYN